MRRLTNITISLLLALLAAPAFASEAQDLRSPDARDSARQVERILSAGQDLRSPDARDSARRVVSLQPPRSSYNALLSKPAAAAGVASSGFRWGDAGIGAAGMLALIAIGAGASVIVTQRRRERRFPAATS
jgi:hypothetical protein